MWTERHGGESHVHDFELTGRFTHTHEVCEHLTGTTSSYFPVVTNICEHQYEFSRYCGATVCLDCDDHKGLARCYCGWPAGEKLEDDIGDSTWNGDEWEVDY